MRRLIRELMDGWEFAFDRKENRDFHPVTLPHDWAVGRPFNRWMDQGPQQGFFDRWGVGWYRRKLKIKPREGKIYLLCFAGIFENSTVWINGRLAGQNRYGYSSFHFDITSLLQKGVNHILIKVDNTASPVDRWYSGAGIYRTVSLLEVPEDHLNAGDIFIKSSVKGKNALLTIQTGKKERIRARVLDGETEYSGESGSGEIQIAIPNVKLWSAASPNLYKVVLSLYHGRQVIDEITENIGIRQIVMDPREGMLVNGETVKLKGLCIHQDAGCLGTAVPREVWREKLLKLKEIGCNAIRAAHHIYTPEFLDLCDEMGFYVYEECFDKWTGGAYGRYFATEWEKDLTCMVKRDRNHPCIFIWGVGNEVERQGQASMLKILGKLCGKVREYDTTRPVTVALNPHYKKESNINMSEIRDIQKFVDETDETEIWDADEKIDRIRKISEYVDVIACNYQEPFYPKIHEAVPDKVILGTEIYPYFKSSLNQMQNYTEEVPWLDVEKYGYVIGGMIWTGIDYLGESMGYPSRGWSGSLFRTNMERRFISYLYQSYWTEKPMVRFAVLDYSVPDEGVKEHWDFPHYYSHWEFPQFSRAVIPFAIASNCEEVELYLDDRRFYVKRPAQFPNRLITGYLPYTPGAVTAVGLNHGKQVCRHQLKTPGPAVALTFDEAEKEVCADKPCVVQMTVRAIDREGNPNFQEKASVRFQVEGNGGIIGVDNGDLMSLETYRSHETHLLHGQASIAVQLIGAEGRTIIRAFSDGLFSGRAIIISRESPECPTEGWGKKEEKDL